jgi:hypothetical protein
VGENVCDTAMTGRDDGWVEPDLTVSVEVGRADLEQMLLLRATSSPWAWLL